jgi:hypothetical protein
MAERAKMDKIKKVFRKFLLLLLALSCVVLSACETTRSSGWRAPDYDTHPNWESDFGYESPRVLSGADGESL